MQVAAADVLSLVVQHCKGLRSIQDICRLLLVSRSVEQQLQQTRGHGHVAFCDRPAVQNGLRLMGFGRWLPQHAGLISSLNLSAFMLSNSGPDLASNVQEQRLQQELCALALQHCRAAQAAAAQAAPALRLQCAIAWDV
jgi:hypothetical protein